MNQPGYSTITLQNWKSFKDYITNFSDNWAFRGQANALWHLNNAIERTDFIHFKTGIEANFVAEFQRGARNYLSKDETPEHLIEWLALMQHHGAPTRLLDFSKSPFIAAYFAFEFCVLMKGHYVAVWCVNMEHLLHKLVTALIVTWQLVSA